MKQQSTKYLLLILLIAVLVIPSVALASWWNPFSWGLWNSIFHFQRQIQNPVACPMIAKLCPDGSSVSPKGPKCEFPACPASNMVGNDKDSHGCIGSAGYSWCELKQKCLRVWEEKCEIEQGDLTCSENSKYIAIAKSDNGVSNIIVKNKTDDSEQISCVYSAEKNDFELKSLKATYFLALTDNFLILDSGTAPEPRGLIVYKLSNQKKVFEDRYARPITTSGDTITYWSPTSIKPTKANCPQLNEWSAGGLGAVIEAHVTLDLTNLSKKDLREYRCNPTQ